MSRTRGSETRRRPVVLTARVSPLEAAAIRQKARSSGQSLSSLFRSALLQTRARPSRLDEMAAARILGQLGKIGSNVNQIAKHLNAGRPGDILENSIELAMRDVIEMRAAVLQFLGMEP